MNYGIYSDSLMFSKEIMFYIIFNFSCFRLLLSEKI